MEEVLTPVDDTYADLRAAILDGLPSVEAEQLLRELWTRRYSATTSVRLMQEMNQGSASFLFDRAVDVGAPHPDRTIAAYGFATPPPAPRETRYQAGFPMIERLGLPWDRGHLVPHTGGGLFGPNIFAQNPDLNRGRSQEGRLYRKLETRAATLGLFFFCALLYCDDTDIPAVVEIGVVEDRRLEVHRFHNRLDAAALSRFPREPLSLLECFSQLQLADLGEETARAQLDDRDDTLVIDMGDSGASRTEGRQDLDLVVAIDGALIAVEVKTRYFGAKAGRLTRAGNLYRPRFNRAGAGSRQGTSSYAAERLAHVLAIDGDPDVVMCAVDLRAFVLQLFEVTDGRIVRPVGPPEDCRDAVVAAMEEMPERLRLGALSRTGARGGT